MYLINTLTLLLQAFTEPDISDYVILSHRWEAGEVLYHDVCDGKAEAKAGYSKMRECCNQALSAGWEYAWIDTCCIDKSSSAELSEAINSMYRWYENAQACYAYLSDVDGGLTEAALEDAIRKSEWFTRGWTLQELLAPRFIVFYDKEWKNIGTKGTLGRLIESITKIDTSKGLDTACVAQKMSWAAQRKTSRVEDVAYSLMGLFGVNMTPIYGEGSNAFIRLQLEIINRTDDESIFAWITNKNSDSTNGEDRGGLLADSPAAFANSGDIRRKKTLSLSYTRPAYSMTSKGLHMEQILLKPEFFGEETEVGVFLAMIQCVRKDSTDFVCIYLRRLFGGEFRRVHCSRLASCSRSMVQEVGYTKVATYVRQFHPRPRIPLVETRFCIDASSAHEHGFVWGHIFPRQYGLNDLRRSGHKLSGILKDREIHRELSYAVQHYPPYVEVPFMSKLKGLDSHFDAAFYVVVNCVDGQVAAGIELRRIAEGEPGLLSFTDENYVCPSLGPTSDRLRSGETVSLDIQSVKENGQKQYLVMVKIAR